jgi:UDP-N-acetylmuramoyl-L-alanyl-D-glutamate--2,6-diaminopimelate ligase
VAPLDLVALHRRFVTLGVTGTNGKTSTTSWVAAAVAATLGPCPRITTLGAAVVTCASTASDASDERACSETELAVARSYEGFVATMQLAAERGAVHAAVECTSEALAAGFARRWPAQIAAFTNLTHDHLDAHGSPEHYLASKAQLFLSVPPGGTAVINGCDPAGSLLAEVVPAHARILRYGLATRGVPEVPLDLEALDVSVERAGTRFALRGRGLFQEVPATLAIRAHGAIFVENALCAIAAVVALGVPVARAARAVAAAAPPPGRFELVHDAPLVAVDYAHTPDALGRTLDTARALARGRVHVVFGAGGLRDRDKRPEMGRAAAVADRIVLTSDNPRDEDPAAIAAAIRVGLVGHGAVVVELDRAAAIQRALREAGPDDVVVIAGKGHERTQLRAGVERPFDDAEVVRRYYSQGSRSAVPSPCASSTPKSEA